MDVPLIMIMMITIIIIIIVIIIIIIIIIMIIIIITIVITMYNNISICKHTMQIAEFQIQLQGKGILFEGFFL